MKNTESECKIVITKQYNKDDKEVLQKIAPD